MFFKVLSYVLVFIVYFPILLNCYPPSLFWVSIPLAFIAEIMIPHLFQLLLRAALLLTFCSLLSSTVNIGHAGRHNRKLKRLVMKFSKRKYGSDAIIFGSYSSAIISPLEAILTEHARLSIQVLRSNADIFGNIVFVSLAFNIPINVALVSRVLFNRLPPLDVFFMYVFILIQFGLIVVALYPLALEGKPLHYAVDVPRLQMLLSGNGIGNGNGNYDKVVGGGERGIRNGVTKTYLRLKIKYMLYYERIHSTFGKYGISIGPTMTLTTEVLWQVCIFIFF